MLASVVQVRALNGERDETSLQSLSEPGLFLTHERGQLKVERVAGLDAKGKPGRTKDIPPAARERASWRVKAALNGYRAAVSIETGGRCASPLHPAPCPPKARSALVLCGHEHCQT